MAVACGGRAATSSGERAAPSPRVIPLARAIVLETSGSPPSDTSVTFTAGEPRTIILRHGPPDNVVFAELIFPPNAFADSGRAVRVDVRPRPGVYGVDLGTTLSLRSGATIVFKYARYFSAPARARAVYGSDVAFERALAVGEVLPAGTLNLLPSTRPAADNLSANIRTPGRYLVAAPE
ncbi:MAG TPA: hypothetical protein VH763_18050 [Gemmatimonadales bacterium]|jgi:hypothetical protein